MNNIATATNIHARPTTTNHFMLTDDEAARLAAGETVTHQSGYKLTLDTTMPSDTGGTFTPVHAEPPVAPTWTDNQMLQLIAARDMPNAEGFATLRALCAQFGSDKYSAMMRRCDTVDFAKSISTQPLHEFQKQIVERVARDIDNTSDAELAAMSHNERLTWLGAHILTRGRSPTYGNVDGVSRSPTNDTLRGNSPSLVIMDEYPFPAPPLQGETSDMPIPDDVAEQLDEFTFPVPRPWQWAHYAALIIAAATAGILAALIWRGVML